MPLVVSILRVNNGDFKTGGVPIGFPLKHTQNGVPCLPLTWHLTGGPFKRKLIY